MEDLAKLTTVGWTRLDHHVFMSSRRKFTQDQRKHTIPSYLEYKDIIKYADSYQRSHKLEVYLAHELQKLGLDAEALPAKADGNTKAKQADIIITTASGQKLALEVKEARNRGCTLGLPLEKSFTTAYTRYPKQLYIDSCSAWDAKERACERRSELLLGAVILCPIGQLSDEEFTVLGAVYCPSENWRIRETSNRGRYYDAYVATRSQMKTLAELLDEVNSYEQE